MHNSLMTEFKKGHIPWNKDKKCPKISISQKGHHNSLKTEFKAGHIVTKEMREKISKTKKGCISWNTGLTKENNKSLRSVAIKASKRQKGVPKNKPGYWKGRKFSEEHIKKCLTRRIPTSLEKKFQEIVDKYNLPYRYVGNGNFFIERCNPDFINTNNEKIAVEVYARYYKLRHDKTIEEWKKERSGIFAKYGWKVIYLNEIQVNKNYVLNILQN